MNRFCNFKRRFLLPVLIMVLSAFSQTTFAQSGIFESYAILDINGGGNAFYDMQATTGNPDFQGANLGNFTTANSIVVRGGQNKTFKCAPCDITNGTFYYRVWLTSAGPSGAFTNINEPFLANLGTGCGGNDQSWEGTSGAANIISGLTTPGNYTIEVYSAADYQGCGTGTHLSNNGGLNYRATFNFCGSGSGALPVGNYAIPGCFATVAAAISYINTNGVTGTGTVQFDLAGGNSETAPPTGIVLTATGTATTAIKFVKTGAGAYTINAGVGTLATPNSANPDGILKLAGADYITIDGITFTDGNSASAIVAMEFGIAMFKLSVTDGCNNNTIQNCTFNMQRISNGSGGGPLVEGAVAIGIYNSLNGASNVTATPTAASGSNSNNKIYSNTINGGNYGIAIIGFAASTPFTLADQNNDIGGVTAGTGNQILNYGGGAAANPAAAIRTLAQYGLNISYNTIDNNNGGGVNHATTLRGIYTNTATSASETISNNNVTVRSGATTSQLTAIDNAAGSTAAGNTISINTNTIRFSYTTATTGLFTAISNSSTAGTINISNNNIQQLASTNYPSTGTVPVIVGGSPGGPMNITNNTISNFVMTGASGTLRAITASTPTGLYTVTGNTIENLSYTTVTSTGSITGIYNLASATLENVNNNIIRNFSTPTTGTLNGIQNNTVAGTFQCQNNQIYNFTTTAGGAGGFSANGITWSNANVTISGNIIYAINSTGTTGGTGGTINGITHSGAATVSRNAVYDLSSNSTNVVITGITTAATGTNTVSNNLIGDLRAPNSTGNIAISGMLFSSGTTNNIFHNTVNIASTTTSVTTFGTSAIYFSSSTPVNNLRNNIFVNTSAPGPTGGFTAAIRYTTTPTSTNFPAANNNNFYYAGTPAANSVIYCEGSTAAPTNGQQTIANYKTYISVTLPVAGREAASVSEVPNWVSTTGSNPITTFLQYNTGIATQIEQGGLTGTGITVDYAGTTRCPGGGCPGASTTPDIGAWELNGLPSDLSAPSISAIALAGNACGLVSRNATAVLADASGVATGALAPRIYFRKNGGAYSSDAGTLSSGTVNSGTWTFTITYATLGGVVVTDVIDYFIVAQDINGNVGGNPSGGLVLTDVNTVTTPPTTPLTYTIANSIGGVINVGSGEPVPYNTLTSAINTYNTSCLSGPVTFNLMDATYSGSETFPIVINTNADASATNTLTIKPNTTSAITGSSASALIRLNGADYVIIDGSNSGSTDKSLTIENTSAAASTAAIWVSSAGTGAGATNNTIKNCNIKSGAIGAAANTFGIYAGGTAITTSGTGDDNDNLTIQNNSISKCYYGIYAQASATGVNNNLTIIQNSIGSTSATDYVTFRGMLISQADNAAVNQNTVFNIISSESVILRGMEFGSGVTNSNISRNMVNSIRNTTTTGFRGGQGISVNTTNPANITIANNVIYDLLGHGSGTMTNNCLGIMILGGGGYNVYYNSVNLSGTLTSTSSVDLTAAMYIASSVTNVNMRNNAFVTTAIPGNATGKSYGIYCLSANTAFTVINYNDFYAPGTTNRFAGFLTSDRTTLADIQAGFGQNVNSLVADPLFNSNTNLIPQLGSPLLLVADNSTGITNDFLGTARSATPTIGAYETAADAVGPVITYTALTNTCALGARTLTAAISDPSGVPTSGPGLPVLYWRINAGAWSAATGTFISGNNYDFTFGSGAVVNDVVQYYIVAQDAFATPNVSAFPSAGAGGFTVNPPAAATPPTTPSSYTIQTTLAAGTYTVGGAGTYTTLTAAIAAYNTSCLGGAIVFELLDATYTTPAETFPLQINANGDASSSNTLTIRPAAGIASTVTASTSTILKLNGADFVTIDGLNSGGSSLTFSNTNTVTGTTVVWLGSLGAAAGATNNTVRNCTIENGTVGSSTVTNFGVFVGQTSGAANGEDNDNNTIQSNIIRRTTIGIQAIGGTVAGQQNDNMLIDNNFIGDAVVADALGRYGMNVGQSTTATVSRNTVLNAITTSSSITATNNSTGIIISTGTTNSIVTRNNISGIRYTSTGGYGGKGIDINTGNAASNVTVSNNFVSDITGDGWSDATTDGICGIRILGTTGGINLYHNTVNLGSGSFAGNTSGTESGALVIGSTVTALNIRDNILTTNLVNSNAAGAKTYAIISETATNAVFSPVNYNDYAPIGAQGFVGRLNNIDYATMAAWQGVSGGDANSINITPSFVSATDLHLFPTAQPVFKAGTPIAGIGMDYDNNARNLGLPTIGADEIYVPNLWAGTVSTVWDGATTGNWDDGVVPAAFADVTIPFGVPNMPAIAAATSVNNVTFTGSGATLSLNGQALTITGAVTGTGTLTGSSTSDLLIGGATNLNFTQTTAATRSLNNFTLQTATANATLGNALDVYGTIQLVGGATLNMASQAVTLKSNATNTARIADLTGQTLTGASNVTMERWIKLRLGGTGRAYRLLTPTVNTTGSMNANWMEGGMNTAIGSNVNPIPLFGTQITGPGGNANGFDKTVTNQSSIYNTANGTTPTYSAIGSTSGTLNALTGYFMYVRGDRSMDMQIPLGVGMPTSSTTLRATGALLQGTQTTFTNPLLAGAGVKNLITNPYPSVINWASVYAASTDISDSYTFWDPNFGTRGGFVTVNTAGVASSGLGTQYIQSGQAFFVESLNATPPTVSIQESHKAVGNNNDVFLVPPPPVESFRTELYFTEPNGFRRITDGAIAVYNNSYSAAVDAKDARDINNWDENIAYNREGKNLAIESRPVIEKSDDLPIFMNNMKKQAYEFEFTPLVFTNTNLKAELVDNYLGTRTLLSVVSPTVVSFNVTDDPASKATDRFKVVFGEFGNPAGVDVITIKAGQQNNGVQVNWTSKTETDMVRYEVEKSTYGTTFVKVNSTAAFGNSTNPVDYNWFDTNPDMGTNFYRIKGIDKTGNVRYSEAVRVLFGKGEPSIVVYPNPLQGNTFRIDMYNLTKGTYVLNLYNSMGQLVYTEQLQHDGSQATRTINLKGDIGKGTFQLQLSGINGFKTTQHIIKN